MSPLLFLALSLVTGLLGAAAMIHQRRRAPDARGTRAIVACWFLLGFGLVMIVEELCLGTHAVPAWHHLLGHLYMPCFGLLLVRGLPLADRPSTYNLRPIGWVLLVTGTLNLLVDLYAIVART